MSERSSADRYEEFATIMAQKVKASDSDAELRAAFKVFDKDGSGTINAQELFQVMKQIGEDFTEAQIDEMLKEADHDGNGTIDCEYLSHGQTVLLRSQYSSC